MAMETPGDVNLESKKPACPEQTPADSLAGGNKVDMSSTTAAAENKTKVASAPEPRPANSEIEKPEAEPTPVSFAHNVETASGVKETNLVSETTDSEITPPQPPTSDIPAIRLSHASETPTEKKESVSVENSAAETAQVAENGVPQAHEDIMTKDEQVTETDNIEVSDQVENKEEDQMDTDVESVTDAETAKITAAINENSDSKDGESAMDTLEPGAVSEHVFRAPSCEPFYQRIGIPPSPEQHRQPDISSVPDIGRSPMAKTIKPKELLSFGSADAPTSEASKVPQKSTKTDTSSFAPDRVDESANLPPCFDDDSSSNLLNSAVDSPASRSLDDSSFVSNSMNNFDETSNMTGISELGDESSNQGESGLESTATSVTGRAARSSRKPVSNAPSYIDTTSSTATNTEAEAPAPGVFSPPLQPSFPADKLFEYQWPQDKTGDLYMLQEQVSEYLGVLSFKRKYPGLQRRPIDMQERIFLREKLIVTETQCDLGLTAVKSDEVCELMMKDYPEKYQAYAKVLQEREKQRQRDKHKNYGMPKMEKSRMDYFMKKAVRSAAEFNAQLMRERREERKAYFDLQTMEVHYPRNQIKILPPEATKVSAYPVALIPGQYQEYYKEYTPQQLKYFPLNTTVYDPPKHLKTIYADPNAPSQDDSSSEKEDDGSYHSDSSDNDATATTTERPSTPNRSKAKKGKTPKKRSAETEAPPEPPKEPPAVCATCTGTAIKNALGQPEELVRCAECGKHGHPSCLELTDEMIPMIKLYPWQCMECKTCVKCMDAEDEDKMMFCDHCDRGYHTFCVGLRSIPTGRWECPSCRPDDAPTPKAKRTRTR